MAKAEGNVKGSIKLHLAALARFLNLRTTLTDEHIEFIADRMLADDNYKWLKPADLKIFFERIKMGKYGDFYGNLNSISFFQSLDKYMIERNGEIENLQVLKQREQVMDIKPGTLSYTIDENGSITLKPSMQKDEKDKPKEESKVRSVVNNAKVLMMEHPEWGYSKAIQEAAKVYENN